MEGYFTMVRLFLIGLIFIITSCSSGQYTQNTNIWSSIDGPKEMIVLTGTDQITNIIMRDLRRKGIAISVLPPNVKTKDDVRYGMEI